MFRFQERRLRLGFTLVELLVVIGIIAVLIGILLPTLARAREAGKRTECLSNLRTMYQFLKIYEVTYKGASPLGFGGLEMQANYFVTRGGSAMPSIAGTTIRYVGLGLLFASNVAKEGTSGGKAFFCPSFQGDVNHDYGSESNPWPPSNPFYDGSSTPKHGCRLSYSQRPITTAVPSPGFPGRYDYYAVQYDKDTPNWPPKMDPRRWPTGTWGTASYTFPKLAKLKNVAIISDINSGEGRLVIGHKKGMNVLYNTGAARFIDIKSSTDLGGVRNDLASLIAAETGYGSGFDKTQVQIWMTLDAQ